MSLFSSDEPVAVPAPTAQPLAEPHPEPADVPELVTALAVGKVNAHRRQRLERTHHLADMLAVDASGGDPWRGPIFAPVGCHEHSRHTEEHTHTTITVYPVYDW